MDRINQIKVLKRFRMIFHSTGMTKADFANLLEIAPPMLERYYTGKSELKNLADKLIDLGYSVDWMYTGEGEMILNHSGTEYNFSYLNKYKPKKQKERIAHWIEKTFETIENFEEESNLDTGIINRYLDSNDIINYDIFLKLKSQGCNIIWTITGDGKKFLDNKIGRKNYNRYLINKNGKQLK